MKDVFDLEEKRLRREVARRGARRVLLQLPEGLKPEAPRLAAIVQEAGALAVVSADPCYGACDLALQEAEALDVDLIVHYGHTPIIRQKRVPTVYFEARARISVKAAVRRALPLLRERSRIGLVTTVQHAHTLEKARDLLLKAGKTVVVGSVGHIPYAGQVIGCDYSNVRSVMGEVDAFLLVGGGRFHAIGVALATAKSTVVADPYEGRAYSVDQDARRTLQQRWASIHEAEEAGLFGVLVGLKTGQKRVEQALAIRKKLEEKGRKAVLLALMEITPERLMQFPTIDAFVNTACPRVSLDAAPRFRKPVLTPNEVLVLLGEMEWEELCRKGWFESAA